MPATFTNAIAISTAHSLGAALSADGTIGVWGSLPNFGDPTPLPRLSNVVLLACGGDRIFARGHNAAPSRSSTNVGTYVNTDRTHFQLPDPFDPNNDPLQVIIKSPPAVGALFQYSDGARGQQITSGSTVVTDSLRRLIYSPPSNSLAAVYGAFDYFATDGELSSPPQSASVQIYLPTVPHLEPQKSA